MAREIKFRAWDGKRMIQDYKIGYSEGNYKYSINDEFAYAREENIIFMQFTGLLDNNGKEIYEDDVIIAFWFDPGGLTATYRIMKIDQGEPIHTGWDFCEILGNIHENKDLLDKITK